MQDDLDHLLTQLAARPAPPLSGLESRVLAKRTARWRELSPRALWGWRSAAAAMLLLIGLATEAAAPKPAAPELGGLGAWQRLAPSTLLGEAK
jgi:hypothetical protein